MIASTDRGADWRPMTDADARAVRACADARARNTPGALDRGPYIWDRILNTREGPAEAYVADSDAGRIEAYCVYRLSARTDGPATGNASGKLMTLADFGYANGQGLDRLLGFLRGFASVVGEIEMAEHPGSPLIARLPDRRFGVTVREPWMLRVVDVAVAMEARGYASALACDFELHVHDPLIEANNAPLRVCIELGRATATPTNQPAARDAVELDIRHLAPLYSGMQSATQLARLGLVKGRAESLAALDAAFACTGGPCMYDYF